MTENTKNAHIIPVRLPGLGNLVAWVSMMILLLGFIDNCAVGPLRSDIHLIREDIQVLREDIQRLDDRYYNHILNSHTTGGEPTE